MQSRVQLEASTSGRCSTSINRASPSVFMNGVRRCHLHGGATPRPDAAAAAAQQFGGGGHGAAAKHRPQAQCLATAPSQEATGEWSDKLLSLTKKPRKRKSGGGEGGGATAADRSSGLTGRAAAPPQRQLDALEVQVTDEELLAADMAGDDDEEWGGELDEQLWGGDGGGGGKMVGSEKRLPPAVRCFDTARIYIKSGDGGAGCVAFRREPFVEHGGPNGGNGGRGGNVWAVADESLNSLLPFRHQAHFRAHAGAAGAWGTFLSLLSVGRAAWQLPRL